MKLLLMTLLCTMLAITFPSLSIAQQSPAASVIPWNNLVATRVSTTYHTIIGATGTTRVPGSSVADVSDTTFPLHLPFAVRFISTNYPAGSTVRVGVGGFLSFTTTTRYGFFPYDIIPDPDYSQIIMPYWSDLITTGAENEGIYQCVTVDPSTGDSTWTIEWSVETMTYPFTSGRFQLHLQQLTNYPLDPRTQIQFDYDTSSPLDRTGTDGVQTGLKNVGQYVGLPIAAATGADDDKYLLMTFPGAVTPYMIAATRLPTRKQYYNYTPDWFGRFVYPCSEFFHYTFPDSSYRMKPIDADAICLLPPDPNHFGGHAYNQGTQVNRAVTVRNNGITTLTGGTLHSRTNYPTGIVDTFSTTLPSLAPNGTATAQIPIKPAQSGAYNTVVWIQMSQDQNRANDTTAWSYFVAAAHDGMATAILSPAFTGGGTPSHYVVGSPIPVQIRLANVGSQPCPFFITGYMVLDTNDSIVGTRRDTINGSLLLPGSEQTHTFASFVPHQPGSYRIKVFCTAGNDSLHADDTLFSVPSMDWTSHGPGSDVRGVAPMPFLVSYPTDLAVGNPAAFPHLPRSNDTVPRTPVMALFGNNGAFDRSNVVVHAAILDENDSVVYNRTEMIASIGAGRMCQHFFADFTPSRSGRYCITVWVQHDSLDPVSANDTTHWCFYAEVDSTHNRPSGGGMLGAIPEPSGYGTHSAIDTVAGLIPMTMRSDGTDARRIEYVAGLMNGGR